MKHLSCLFINLSRSDHPHLSTTPPLPPHDVNQPSTQTPQEDPDSRRSIGCAQYSAKSKPDKDF
jgi:hypothetical protein